MPDQIERTIRSLGGQLPGRVSLPGEDGYAAATAIWAKPVGRMPRAVVHCRTTDDVQSAVRTARDCCLPLSVRGGGHHWAGRALCAGIVIDLSGMNSTRPRLWRIASFSERGGAEGATARPRPARLHGPGGFDTARDITAMTVNRWPHGYAYEYDPLFDPDWQKGEAPHEIGRAGFGPIAIANSDSAAAACTDAAIDQAHRLDRPRSSRSEPL